MVYPKAQCWVPCFFIYINDLPNISKKLKYYIFADDTNIYLESVDLQSLEKIMNKELGKLFEWLYNNRLSLNISKTNFIIFCPVNKSKFPVTILINKEAIDEAAHVKYLGILIDSQCPGRYFIQYTGFNRSYKYIIVVALLAARIQLKNKILQHPIY